MSGSEQQSLALRTEPDFRRDRIARLNDEVRKTNEDSITFFTRDAALFAGGKIAELLKAVGTFNGFDETNDANGERQFGKITFHKQEIVFRIDYYDEDGVGPAKDPADAEITTRIMIVMLASEDE